MDNHILSVEGLTVSFDGFVVLDSLDFSLSRGELRFLIGPNGAGKTTLLDLITGKTKPSGGKIIFDGDTDLTKLREHDLVKLGIGRKFQTPSIFSSLTVYENMEVAVGFRRNLGALLRPLHDSETEWIDETLEKVGLTHRTDTHAGTLSHGEKQWLEVGMLLAQEPKLMLLDEPVAGMTRREREHTGALLQSIGQDRSVLVVEHDMEFVRHFAEKVTVLHQGKVLSEGPMDKVQNDPEVVRAYLGRTKTRATVGAAGSSQAD
jgi:urea transport system ATP-binding protein